MKNIKSMTGYGKGMVTTDLRRITVELKSLNSKQVDLSARIPSIYREQEFEIRSRVSKALLRGKIDLYVSFENISVQTSTTINNEIFEAYKSQIDALQCDKSNTDYVSTILRLPDVLNTSKIDIDESEMAALSKAVDIAISEIDTFRQKEGEVMMRDILLHISQIESLLKEVDKYESTRVESIRSRIMDNIKNTGVNVDMNRLEQEMIFYIEKLDVTEEKVRLQKHIDYFREVCNGEEGVGKKLGFVTQEIGREINTLGSKSNNFDMQQIVVNMKDELEKIKEQLLNIL